MDVLQISTCPQTFDGGFDEFFEKHVEPNLPTPERVEAFDALIDAYMRFPNAVFVVRQLRGMKRGVRVTTRAGDAVLPGDNAPGWWTHAKLMDDGPLDDAASFFENIPTHFLDVARMPTLNTASYHLAHIIPVKNGDLDWIGWTRSELCRRFLLNIHPCNWFLLARDGKRWQNDGQRQDILDWTRATYLRRYGDLYVRFLARVGQNFEKVANEIPVPRYSIGNSLTGVGVKASDPASASAKASGFDRLRLNRPLIRKNLLGSGKILDLKVLGTRYLIPHDQLVEWAETHTSICGTRSWRERGIYSWPNPSRAMLDFLSRFRVED